MSNFFKILLLAGSITMHTTQASAEYKTQWTQRQGEPPQTTEAPKDTNIAHRQISQNEDMPFWQDIITEVSSWPHINKRQSLVSVAGAIGFFINPSYASNTPDHFMRGTEFAHIHPIEDGSFHVVVPTDVRDGLIEAKWAEPHPRKPHIIMLYAPRDRDEFTLVMEVLRISYEYSLKNKH